MDTAKIDVEKLQILCDRINQTIEALNQVRLTVHGVQSAPTTFIPGAGLGGLSHSAIPQTIDPRMLAADPRSFGIDPRFGAVVVSPWMQAAGAYGLSHSPYDARLGVDPYAVARLTANFPFLQRQTLV